MDRPTNTILQGDCISLLSEKKIPHAVDLTFLDPPFNQSKEYASWDDNLPPGEYWGLMQQVCKAIFSLTSLGGALYFMQREKNTDFVLQCLRDAGWTLQNLIIWKKKTSAVPCIRKFGKHYQVIAFVTKGPSARVFNRLRIAPPLPANYKYERHRGVYVTDVWDDIRELTAGYFAGDEALRKNSGERLHKQQSPIALLLRIILSSTNVGDTIFDPFAGTGTALVVAQQLQRHSVGVELDPENVRCIKERMKAMNKADSIVRFYEDYRYTEKLAQLWPREKAMFSHSPILKKYEPVKLF
ncbi:MAG: site-specific DNA-methyltransferase [Candidatus Liptonbacteria bacterium]|nr:site-specific DNA-methyltransferase [Candidatus Liptonbacteria bacterium]